MPEKGSSSRELWPAERQGYSESRPHVAYANVREDTPIAIPQRKSWFSPLAEARIADCIMGGGLIWFVHNATSQGGGTSAFVIVGIMPPGPLEIMAIGALVWLHAKWRQSAGRR